MITLRRFLWTALLVACLAGSAVMAQPVAQTAVYDEDGNYIDITFDEAVRATDEDIIFTLLTITDGSASYTLAGGTQIIEVETATTVRISLIFMDIIDSYNPVGGGDTRYCWGHNTVNIETIDETFSGDGLQLTIGAGAFRDEGYRPNEVTTIPMSFVPSSVELTVTGVEYNAQDNTLELSFSAPVQFDQLPEDLLTWDPEGPSDPTWWIRGNGQLDFNPREDRNGNNVLDMESNLRFSGITLVDDEGGEYSFAASRGLLDLTRADSDVMLLKLNRTDRAQVEKLLAGSLQMNTVEYTFVDVNYNPVTPVNGFEVDFIPETDPLELDSINYSMDTNELSVWFDQPLDADSLLTYISFSRFYFQHGDMSVPFTGGAALFIDNYYGLKITLNMVDAQVLEEMVDADPTGTFILELEPNAVYSESENANILTTAEIVIIPEDPEYARRAPSVLGASYDAYQNILHVDFDVRIDTEFDVTGFTLVLDEETSIQLGEDTQIARVAGAEGNNTAVNLTLISSDYIPLEINDGREAMTLDIEAYSVVSQRSLNGNRAVSGVEVDYIANMYEPLPTYFWYGYNNGILHLRTSQLIDPSLVDFTRLTFEGVQISTPVSVTQEEDGTIIASLTQADQDLLNAIPMTDWLTASVSIEADFLTNNDNVFTAAVTLSDRDTIYSATNPEEMEVVMVGIGREFNLYNFRQFPEVRPPVPVSLRAISDHAVWWVANDQWIPYEANRGEIPLKQAELDAAIAHFETRTPVDTTRGAYEIVTDFLVGDDASVIPTVNFILADVQDEFGVGANGPNPNWWKHGYYNPDDINEPTSEEDDSNGMDVVFIDCHPQNFIEGEISNYQDDEDAWATAGEEVNYGLAAISNMYAEYITFKLDMFEEMWVRIGMIYLAEMQTNGFPEFYGGGSPSGLAGNNDVTIIPDQYNSSTNQTLLESKTDYYHAFMFMLYLYEQYGGDDLIQAIAHYPRTGTDGLEMLLDSRFDQLEDWQQTRWADRDDILRGIFMDFATANLLDTTNVEYDDNGVFVLENMYTRNKVRGSRLEFKPENPPPYTYTAYEWGYRYFFCGYDLPIDNPLLTSPGTSDVYFFGGSDATNINVRKINYFALPTDTELGNEYLVQDFTLDNLNSGSVPMSPGAGWVFGPDEAGDGSEFPLWSMIVLGGRGDFRISERSEPAIYTRLFVVQNPAISNKVDLYVLTELPLFNEENDETPVILCSNTSTASDTLTLYDNPDLFEITEISSSTTELKIYHHSTWLDTEGDEVYWFLRGYYANGLSVGDDGIVMGTQTLHAGQAESVSMLDDITLNVSPEALDRNLLCTIIEVPDVHEDAPAYLIPEARAVADAQGRIPVSAVYRVGPGNVDFNDPVRLTMRYDAELSRGNEVGIYTLYNGQWVYVGGSADGEFVSTRVTRTGSYRVMAGTPNDTPGELMIPSVYALQQNYPNPFNPTTTIVFDAPETGHVSLVIYDVLGREVVRLLNEEVRYGTHRIVWNGMDQGGAEVASGVYFLQMTSGGYTEVKRMVMVH